MEEIFKYITSRLFIYLETHPEEVMFDWVKLKNYGTEQIIPGSVLSKIDIKKEYVDIIWNDIDELDAFAILCIKAFIQRMNLTYNDKHRCLHIQGIGFYSFKNDSEWTHRVFFSVASIVSKGTWLSENTLIKEPKKLKIK